MDCILHQLGQIPLSGANFTNQAATDDQTLYCPKSPVLPYVSSEFHLVNWEMIRKYHALLGTIHVGRGRLRHGRRLNKPGFVSRDQSDILVWRLQFHPSGLIMNKGYIMNGMKTSRSWQYIITPYNLRPPDSLIFLACENRDLATVRRLLDEGLASPFDLSPRGATPLHVRFPSSTSKSPC